MKQLPDDGRDLVPELAAAIAYLSEGIPALVVLSGQIIAKLPRQEQLRFLAGDMSVLNPNAKTVRRPRKKREFAQKG